jgi:hypothetical protein
VFALKNTTSPTATKILIGVLGIMAFTFAIPLLKDSIDPTKTAFNSLTGLQMDLNVVLLATVIGILWKGNVQNRFVRFLLWVSLIIFIPASIAASVKVIKQGLTEFTNEVPVITNLPTYLPDSTPDWFKELWGETVPFLKGLPLGAKWLILGGTALFVVFLLYIFFRSRRVVAPATTGATGSSGLLGAVIALALIAILVGLLFFTMKRYDTNSSGGVPAAGSPSTTATPTKNTTIPKGKVVESTGWEEETPKTQPTTSLKNYRYETDDEQGSMFVYTPKGWTEGEIPRYAVCGDYTFEKGFYYRGGKKEVPPPGIICYPR